MPSEIHRITIDWEKYGKIEGWFATYHYWSWEVGNPEDAEVEEEMYHLPRLTRDTDPQKLIQAAKDQTSRPISRGVSIEVDGEEYDI